MPYRPFGTFEDDDDFPNFPCGGICYCSFSWRVVVQVELVVEKLEVLWPSTSLMFSHEWGPLKILFLRGEA